MESEFPSYICVRQTCVARTKVRQIHISCSARMCHWTHGANACIPTHVCFLTKADACFFSNACIPTHVCFLIPYGCAPKHAAICCRNRSRSLRISSNSSSEVRISSVCSASWACFAALSRRSSSISSRRRLFSARNFSASLAWPCSSVTGSVSPMGKAAVAAPGPNPDQLPRAQS